MHGEMKETFRRPPVGMELNHWWYLSARGEAGFVALRTELS